MSYYLDFYGTDSLSNSLHTVSMGTPVPAFETRSKIYDLLLPFFQLNQIRDDLRSSKLVKAFKILTSCGAIVARIPLLPLSLNFHPEIKGLGQAVACCNMVSFSSFLMWSSKDMIDHVFYALKTSEHKQTKSLERCRQIAIIALSSLSGLASQLPYIFLAWKYNPSNKAMVVLSGFDVIPPVYSLYLTMNHMFSKYACSYTTQKVLKVKKYLLERLDMKMKQIINGKFLGSEFDIMLSREMSTLDSFNYFFSDLTQDSIEFEPENLRAEFIQYKIAQAIGTVLICAQLFWTGYLSYQGVDQLTSNKIELGFIFTYVIICNLALTRFVLIGSIYKLISSASYCLSNQRSYNYIAERLMPKTTLALRALVLIIASASFIPAVTLSNDFLDQNYTMLSFIPYGLALVFMNYLPLKNLVNTSVCYGLNHFGSIENKKEIKVYDHYKSVSRIIENSTPESLGIFLFKLSEQPAFSRILEKFDLSSYELSTLIRA